MVAKRRVSFQRRLSQYSGPIALGAVWLTAVAAIGVILRIQSSSGTTTALAVTRTHALRAPESGWVVEVNAQPGAAVEAGTVLARLEAPGMAQDLVAAEAAVRAAEEGLAMDEADRTRVYAKEVEAARRALLDAQVLLTREQGTRSAAEAELERLSTPGAEVSGALVEQQRALVRTQTETLKTREGQVSALEEAFRAARSRANIAYSGEAALAEAVARRDALRARMSASELRATTAGVVGPLVPTAGEWTVAGSPLITITEPFSNEVVAYVAVPYARRLAVGTVVEVAPEGGSPVPGTIAQIGPAVELVPEQLHPAAPTWSMPVHVTTTAMLAPGETVGVGL